MQMNSMPKQIPAASPAASEPSRLNSAMPRSRHQAAMISAATMERMVDWTSGGISWIASFTATWLKPQDRHSTTTIAAASGSSGRVMWWEEEGEDMKKY